MRLLFLVHNHPDLQPGGTEVLARGLFRKIRSRRGVDGLFLAGCTSAQRERKPGTLLQAVGEAPDEVLVSLGPFDRFFLSQADVYGLASLLPVVQRLRPDVIHVHHLLLFGLEAIDLLRRAAPQAKMVLTLHDYFALCAREGQFLTADGRLCTGASPDACRRCMPERAAMDFTLRDVAIRDACRAFDHLIAPSRFLRDRFVAEGWDAARISVVPNGVAATPVVPYRPSVSGRRDRFALFGNINRVKGTLVALRASARLAAEDVAHGLEVHGGTAHQSEEFVAEFNAALAEAPMAAHRGPYGASDHGARMARADWVVVPSIWWENAPLVILEAFRHRRPVICGGVGGMAELVTDGVDGLHAPVSDPAGLAAVMRRAAEEPDLWAALVQGIRTPPDLDASADAHLQLYRSLRGRHPAGSAVPAAA